MLQRPGHSGNGEVVAHRRPSLRSRKYWSRESSGGAFFATTRGAGVGEVTARTSTLPIDTWIVGAGASERSALEDATSGIAGRAAWRTSVSRLTLCGGASSALTWRS